jgi:MTH538 TIR-like domain (DUF1863).
MAAQRRIETANKRFDAATTESRNSSGYVRHKCFISYHAEDAEEVADFVDSFQDVFIPRAIGVEEDDGSIIDSTDVDYIRDVIRTNYLRDSTVTIVLVGRCTWARRFVDWEIYASLRDGKLARHNGLLGILLPSASSPVAQAPARLIDNVPSKDGSSAYGRYRYYPESNRDLRNYIEDAFQARTLRYESVDNSRQLRQRNSSCS